MKPKYSHLACILFTVSFLQCKKQAESTEAYSPPIFPEKKEITTQLLNNSFIFDIGEINFIDTLIICSGKTDINEQPFHFFSKKSGEYIRSIGRIGQGPGEITLPISAFSTDQSQGRIYAYDMKQFKLTEYTLYHLQNEINSNSKDHTLPAEIRNIRDDMFISLGNNQFISAYNNSFGTSYRFIKSSLNDTISTYNQYPRLTEPEEYIKVEHSYFFYMGALAAKPDGKKFVHATRGGCILEIFDCSDKIIPLKTKRFFEPAYIAPKKDTRYPFIKWDPNAIHGMSAIHCTDKYIYAFYSDSRGENKYNQIAVFDWNGDPVKLLSFGTGIISFVVENNDKKGYALIRDPESDVCLVSFDL